MAAETLTSPLSVLPEVGAAKQISTVYAFDAGELDLQLAAWAPLVGTGWLGGGVAIGTAA
jgi:hypothetical protein